MKTPNKLADIEAVVLFWTLPPASRSAPAAPLALMLPELMTVPATVLKPTAAELPVMDPLAVLVTLPPAIMKTPRWGPVTVPALVNVPAPPLMKTPAPWAPPPAIDAPALLLTLPPENSATPSSTDAVTRPEFTIVPKPPWMMIPSSPPEMTLTLVTLPPRPSPTP